MNETSRELMHWGMQKGEKWDNHKYIARVETGKPGKFLYFYDMDKYNAWKNGAKSKLQDTAKGLKDKALNLKNKTQKQVKTSVAKAKDSINVQSKKIAEQALRSKEQLTTAAKKYAKYISYDAKSKAEQVKNKLTKGEADTKKDLSRSKHATNNYPSNNYLTNPAHRDPKFTEEWRATPISDAERKEYDAATKAYNVRKLKENNKSLSDTAKKKLDDLEKKYNNEERGHAADDHMQYRRDQLMDFANNKRNQRPLTAQVPNTPKWQRPFEKLSREAKKTVSSLTKTASDALETGKRQAESMASAAQMSANMLSKKADEAMKNAKSMVDSAMKSGEKAAQHLTKEVSDFVKKTFSDGKKWASFKGNTTFTNTEEEMNQIRDTMKKINEIESKNKQDAAEKRRLDRQKAQETEAQAQRQGIVNQAKAFISNIAHSYVDTLGSALYDAVNKPKKDTSPVIHANDGNGEYLAKLDYPNGDTRYIKNKDDWKRFAEVQKYQNNEREFMHSLPEIEVDEDGKLPTKEQDTKEVNEKIWSDIAKTGTADVIRSVNCVYCSTAYELRRRGYDVEAANLPSNVTATNISRVFDVKDSTLQTETKKIVSSVPINTGDTTYGRVTNRRLTDKGWEYTVTSYKLENHDKNVKSITPAVDVPDGFNTKAEDGSVNKEWKKNIESAIDQQTASFPENSRGMFNVYWKSGGGHSMVWEKDENGKIEIIDTQLGMKMPLDTILAEIDPAAPMQLIRTDDLKVNRGAMFRVVSN